MMIREVSKKTWLLWGLFVVLFLLSAMDLDYSGLSTFSLAMGRDVLKGLSQPDWSFFYDGSGEDLFSLLLLTIGIACWNHDRHGFSHSHHIAECGQSLVSNSLGR